MKNEAQVLDDNLVLFPKDFFWQHGRRDDRCNPFLIVNPVVSSMTFSTNNIPQILGDDTGEKWVQIKGKLKKKKSKRKKIQSIICINCNLKRKKKDSQNKNTQTIIVIKSNRGRFCFVCVPVPLRSYFPK